MCQALRRSFSWSIVLDEGSLEMLLPSKYFRKFREAHQDNPDHY